MKVVCTVILAGISLAVVTAAVHHGTERPVAEPSTEPTRSASREELHGIPVPSEDSNESTESPIFVNYDSYIRRRSIEEPEESTDEPVPIMSRMLSGSEPEGGVADDYVFAKVVPNHFMSRPQCNDDNGTREVCVPVDIKPPPCHRCNNCQKPTRTMICMKFNIPRSSPSPCYG